MANQFEIVSAAATRHGSNPVTAFDNSSKPAQIASANYELVVRNELAVYPWKHATKIAELSLIDEDEEGEPPEPWQSAYQLPDDFVAVRTLKVSGVVIDYEVHGNTLLCDAAEADEVILHYVWRVPEARWPPWFTEGIIRRFEALILRGVQGDYAAAADRDAAADQQFLRANLRDAQSQTPRDPMPSPTLEARRGGTVTSGNVAIRRSATG